MPYQKATISLDLEPTFGQAYDLVVVEDPLVIATYTSPTLFDSTENSIEARVAKIASDINQYIEINVFDEYNSYLGGLFPPKGCINLPFNSAIIQYNLIATLDNFTEDDFLVLSITFNITGSTSSENKEYEHNFVYQITEMV